MSAAKSFIRISSFKTASRCWIPTQTANASKMRHFSSRQRCVNMNNLHESNIISNDDILAGSSLSEEKRNASEYEPFEPIVSSSEDIHTAGPVTKA